MKLILLATCVNIVHSFTPFSSPSNVKGCNKAIFFPSEMKWSDAIRKADIINPLLMSSEEEEFYDAEEAAAYDAYSVSDSGVEAAVMERAVMMAYDMMKKKKQDFKDKVEDARAAEQQYVMMDEAHQDLLKQYNEDVSKPNLYLLFR